MKAIGKTLTVVGLLLSVAASSAMAGNVPKAIRIGVVGNPYGKPYGTGVIGVIHTKGWLDEELKKDGIRVEWYFLKGTGPAINESLANGALDLASYGDLPTIIGKAVGLKTKVVASGGRGQNIYVAVPADSPAKSIQDLRDKRVGFLKGTYMQLQFNRVLKTLGLSEKDFRVYNLSIADGQAALSSGDIDGYVAPADVLQLRTLGVARVIYSSQSSPRETKGFGQFIVTESFAKAYPEVVQRFVNVLVRAARWASDERNREEFLQINAKTGTPYESYKEDYAGASLKERNSPLLDAFQRARLSEAIQASQEKGFIRRPIDIEAWLDPTYLQKAVGAAGLEHYWD